MASRNANVPRSRDDHRRRGDDPVSDHETHRGYLDQQHTPRPLNQPMRGGTSAGSEVHSEKLWWESKSWWARTILEILTLVVAIAALAMSVDQNKTAKDANKIAQRTSDIAQLALDQAIINNNLTAAAAGDRGDNNNITFVMSALSTEDKLKGIKAFCEQQPHSDLEFTIAGQNGTANCSTILHPPPAATSAGSSSSGIPSGGSILDWIDYLTGGGDGDGSGSTGSSAGCRAVADVKLMGFAIAVLAGALLGL